ncbi:MAG: glycerate kinase [Clostridiales bacterium]|nr:glycerate kinase [Clostridiales bacterium]
MKVVVAIDSFKGSLSSKKAGEAVMLAVKEFDKNSVAEVVCLADGGEGTTEALVESLGGEYKSVEVMGPLGDKVNAVYGIINNSTAVIEMATASGITLVEKSRLNPLLATTYGVGEVIIDALNQGCRDFIIGLGGSATNDVGVGMLKALGYEFLDKKGNPVGLGAKALKDITEILDKNADSRLKGCSFTIACDVKNPLVGAFGCSEIFSRQKGATQGMVIDMDRWIDKFSAVVKKYNPSSDKNAQGMGAAGGLGFAFTYFLGGKITPGIELVMSKIGLEEKIMQADLVITGEGKLDRQSAMGKAPVGVSMLAKKYGKKVIAFAGAIGNGAEVLNSKGIDAYFSITNAPCSLAVAMNEENAFDNLKKTALQVLRCLNI